MIKTIGNFISVVKADIASLEKGPQFASLKAEIIADAKTLLVDMQPLLVTLAMDILQAL